MITCGEYGFEIGEREPPPPKALELLTLALTQCERRRVSLVRRFLLVVVDGPLIVVAVQAPEEAMTMHRRGAIPVSDGQRHHLDALLESAVAGDRSTVVVVSYDGLVITTRFSYEPRARAS